MDNSNVGSGYWSIFLCCIANAVSLVFISRLNQTHNQMLSIAMTFGYATILFNLFNFKNLVGLYSSVFRHFKLIFRMNIVTLINWFSSFMALNYLDPASAICIILGGVTVTIFLISTPLRQLRENKRVALCIFLVLISMALIIKQYAATASYSNTKFIVLGVLWCVFGGISGAFIGTHSEKMDKAGFSTTQILATRFYLLVIVSALALSFELHSAPLVIDWQYYFLSTLIIVFFPLIMYQTAIKKLGTLIVSLLEPFTPVITYFLQVLILKEYHFNLLTIVLLTIASGLVVWLVRVEQNIVRKKYTISEAEKMQIV